MLFNQTNNYKSFTAIKELWLTTVFLLSTVLLSFTVIAAGESDGVNNNELVGISYNTIQSDQVVLVFSFAQNISSLPEVKTSMTPAFVEVTFDANAFGKDQKETLVNHAGVKSINLDATSGKVVALISLEKLAVFDVSLNNDKEFSITFNYGKSAEIVETLSPAGDKFINHIESIDFRLNAENEGQILIYLKDNMLAADVNDKLGKLNVEFHNTEILEDLLYKLDVTDFGTLVTSIETFKEGRNARLVIDVDSGFIFTQKQEENLLILI